MGTPPPIQLATLGMWDTLLLMVLALVVFGPRRLPMIGRQIGKLMYEFRKASNDFKFQMEEELRNAEEADRRRKEEEERQRALTAVPPPAQLEATASEAAQSGTPAPDTDAPPAPSAQSPYPGETTCPSTSTQAARSEETTTSSETALAEAVEAAKLRIQPPSTGETVAADRPGAQPQQRELFSEDSSPTSEPASPEAERSEPAAHHG
jgi:sec-independent protein translocase protein TatB